MQETLRQLGELLLNAIPTVVIFLLLYVAYRVLVHGPLMKVLAERHSKTQGAVEKASADVAAAQDKTTQYEHKLRDARSMVFLRQEARREQVMQVRAVAVAEAKAKAQMRIVEAKAAVEADKIVAKAGLAQAADRLAEQIVQAVLKTAGVAGGGH